MRMRSGRIGRNSGPGICGYKRLSFVLGLLVSLAVSAAAADDDAYLRMIQSEASKVQTPGDQVPDSTVTAGTEVDLELFEQELERNYRGSYLFYKKLPERSRVEIFMEYRQGASIEDIRGKIMNRYLRNE